MELALGASWVTDVAVTIFGYTAPPLGLGVVLALGICVAGGLANYAVVHRTPLRIKRG